jgi:predicted phosphoribosyltransferase
MIYRDRREAGRTLARLLARYAGRSDVVVLALPRGGVPVGFEVAEALGAPLDVFVVRKLGVPGYEELAMGAIASGGVRVLLPDIFRELRIPDSALDEVTRREEAELERREKAFRAGRPPVAVEGKTVIIVDDGLATGSTMRAAIAALRKLEPERIVVAVPVGAEATCGEIRSIADECVCASTPPGFSAVGLWYENFDQTSDEEVHELLSAANAATAQGGHPRD